MELIFAETDELSEEIGEYMKKAAALILEHEDIPDENIEVSISFVGEQEIRELNSMYRDNDNVTDVLSFPQFEDKNDIMEEGRKSLGDVVICTDRALAQAEEYGHTAEREIIYLFVHSMFHLLGYDHMVDSDKSAMRRAEEDIMENIGLER